MRNFVLQKALIPELKATNRNEAIREIVESLGACVGLDNTTSDDIARAIVLRENQGTTAFGKGVALPHTKHPAVKRSVAAIAKSSTGIDFAALDREPVYVVVLLLSPPDHSDEHLAAMESILSLIQRHNLRRFLAQASTREQIWDVVLEADILLTGSSRDPP